MKGSIEEPMDLVSVIFFMLGSFMLIVGFISTHNQFTAEVLKPALQKQILSDGTKIFENCIKENEIITPELITKNGDSCRTKFNLAFVKVTDIESGKEWAFGDQNKGQYSYKIFTKIKSGEDFNSGLVYAEA